jgi:hypothetical protein
MKRNLLKLAVPAAIAASSIGCSTEKITSRTDPGRPSIVQVSEGYDTLGRKWGDEKPNVMSRSELVLLNYTGTITDIDYADREMTLKDSQGGLQTFVVGKGVKRFNEAKVGDKVSIDYYVGYDAEVRKPTAEEEQNPLVVLSGSGKAGPDAAPAAYGARQIRAVVTIESLDRVAQTVTVKGPRGKYFTARVIDPSRLEKVHIGDTILMTFTEAAAVSLKPAGSEAEK